MMFGQMHRHNGDHHHHFHGHEHGPGREHGMGRRGGRGGLLFLEPSLLLLLKEKSRHGYELAEAIKEVLPRQDVTPDPSSVYRTLAHLEEVGLITSEWTAGDGGGRKVYTITEEGKSVLADWIQVMTQEIERAKAFIDRYKA